MYGSYFCSDLVDVQVTEGGKPVQKWHQRTKPGPNPLKWNHWNRRSCRSTNILALGCRTSLINQNRNYLVLQNSSNSLVWKWCSWTMSAYHRCNSSPVSWQHLALAPLWRHLPPGPRWRWMAVREKTRFDWCLVDSSHRSRAQFGQLWNFQRLLSHVTILTWVFAMVAFCGTLVMLSAPENSTEKMCKSYRNVQKTTKAFLWFAKQMEERGMSSDHGLESYSRRKTTVQHSPTIYSSLWNVSMLFKEKLLRLQIDSTGKSLRSNPESDWNTKNLNST